MSAKPPETNLRPDQTRFSPALARTAVHARRATTAEIHARFPHLVAGARRLPDTPDIGALAREHCEDAIRELVRLSTEAKSEAARSAATAELRARFPNFMPCGLSPLAIATVKDVSE